MGEDMRAARADRHGESVLSNDGSGTLRDRYAFVGDAVLVYLLRQGSKKHRDIASIAEGTGYSRTAVRNNLSVIVGRTYGVPWVESEGRPAVYTLTDKGREIARHRVRSGAS